MKKIIIALLPVAFALTGCEDFLDSTMKSEYSSENFFNTQESAEQAVTGLYNTLYDMRWWVFGDVASDDAVKGGNAGDQADINAIDDYSASADNGIIYEFWQSTYETIAQANNVIAYVTPMDFDATAKNRLVAEAKFLRAFSYFHLVNIFGEVPLKLEPQSSIENVHVGLSSVAAIYEQIEKDLTAAQALPVSYATETGRVTRGAAYGLLAKAQLYQGKYSEALSSISSLKSLGIYDLEDNYADLFKLGEDGTSNGNSIESIFAIFFLSDQVPATGNALNQWFAPSAEGGYYFNAPTQDWVNCFTEQTAAGTDDPRIDASIGREGVEWFEEGPFESAWAPATGYLVKKHNQPLSEVDAGRKGDGGLAGENP